MKTSQFHENVKKILKEKKPSLNFSFRFGYLHPDIVRQRKQQHQQLLAFIGDEANAYNDEMLAAMIKKLQKESMPSSIENVLMTKLLQEVKRYDSESSYGHHDKNSSAQFTTHLTLMVSEEHSIENVLEAIERASHSNATINYLKINGFNSIETGLQLANKLAVLLRVQQINLRHLHLPGNALGDQAIQILAPILNKIPLEQLSLGDNQLTVESVKLLGQLLQQPALRYLNLDRNYLDELAVEELLKSLRKDDKGLETLSLNGNPLKDKAMYVLSVWLGSSPLALQQVFLAQVSITDKGAKALAAGLQNNVRIFGIDVGNNLFRTEGLQALQKAVDRRAQKQADENSQKLKKSMDKFAKSSFLDWAEQALTSGDDVLVEEYLQYFLELAPDDEVAKTKLEIVCNRQRQQHSQQQVSITFDRGILLQQKLAAKKSQEYDKSPAYINILVEFIETEQDLVEDINRLQNFIETLQDKKVKIIMQQQTRLLVDVRQNIFIRLVPISSENTAIHLQVLVDILFSSTFAWQYAILIAYSEKCDSIIQKVNNTLLELPEYSARACDHYVLANQFLGNHGLLMKPVQRIPRYELLLNRILKEFSELAEMKNSDNLGKIKKAIEVYIEFAQKTIKQLKEKNEHYDPHRIFFHLCRNLNISPVRSSMSNLANRVGYEQVEQNDNNNSAWRKSISNNSYALQLGSSSSFYASSEHFAKRHSARASEEYRECIMTLHGQLADSVIRQYYVNSEELIKPWDIRIAEELNDLKKSPIISQEKLQRLPEYKEFSEFLYSIVTNRFTT